jgi:diguanylate cyclase (GGDEF)-like protein
VRIGSVHGNKAPTGGDGRTTAREWSETLASRYRIPVPAAEFKVKRFACLAGPENGRACLHSTAVRTVERSLFHAGRVVGVLAVHVPAGNREDDRRIDGLIASMSGQIGLFLHRSADLEKIRSLANHDTLTGLLNYLSFQEIFDREFERYRRHGRNMSLLLVDLDNFKRINDTLGHQVGDQVLREVSKILQANLRKTDYIFRYGGDEFVILMAETEAERAAVLAQRLREAVKREVRGVTSGEIPVSTSIGIADCSSLTSMEREELLLRADGALYQAKNAGRDRIQVAPGPLACAVGDLEVTASRFFRPAVSGVRLTQGAV